MTIDIFASCNEHTNIFHREKAEILAEAPQIGDSFDGGEIVSVELARLDPEQPSRKVWTYDVYEIALRYDQEGDFVETHYVAVEKPDDEDEDEPLTYKCALELNESPRGLDLSALPLTDLLRITDELPGWDYPLGEDLITEIARRAGIDVDDYLHEHNADLTTVWEAAAKLLGVDMYTGEPRRYRVLPEFIDAWYWSAPTEEIEAIQAAGMTIDEIRELAEGWDKPIEELMEQVEEI